MFESLVRFVPIDPARAARVKQDRGHRLVWSLFAQNNATRNFLYQPIPGHPFSAVMRSSQPPTAGDGWSITTRAFAPRLKTGQVLAFRIEAVPFRWKPIRGGRRGKREDLITAVRRTNPQVREHPDREAGLVDNEARRWFAQQGAKHGFAADSFTVSVYDQEIFRGGRVDAPIRFASFIYEGRLQVTDVEAFQTALQRGIGAEKAFGFGLIQIAPA
jgi:CRISPR system Cascade subunit CasE